MKKKLLNCFAASGMIFTSASAIAYDSALTRVDIDGVTAIEEDDISELYQKFMDREINEADIEEMKNILNSVYMKKGFPFVKVSAETDSSGSAVNIKVIEAYLKNIAWKGEDEPDYIIRQLIEKYTDNKIFNLTEFQSTLIKINSMNTRKISAIIDKYKDEEGCEVEGAFIITLMEDKGNRGSISTTIDNNASKQLERNQITTTVKLNDPITKNEKVLLSYNRSLMNNDVNAFAGHYEKMLNIHGTTAEYSFNAGTQYPVGLLSDLNFVNKTNSHNIGLNHPFQKDTKSSLYGSLDFTIKNVQTDMLNTKLYSDKIRTVSAGIHGENIDKYNGKNTYSAEYVRGLDILGSSEASSPLSSNTEAKQEFSKLKLQASRNQFLPYNFSFFSRIKGQMTGDNLLLSEKFTVGGMECGRGYNPSEFSGDQGYCLSNELRYTYKTSIDNLVFQPFVHFDNGKVHETKIASGIKSSATASSFGGGSKFNLPMNFTGVVAGSKPVNKKYNGTQKVKRPKLTFMLGYNFDF